MESIHCVCVGVFFRELFTSRSRRPTTDLYSCTCRFPTSKRDPISVEHFSQNFALFFFWERNVFFGRAVGRRVSSCPSHSGCQIILNFGSNYIFLRFKHRVHEYGNRSTVIGVVYINPGDSVDLSDTSSVCVCPSCTFS